MGVQGNRRNVQHEALIGRTLQKGEYRIEAILGYGGMGQVYLASYVPTDMPVAIKQVRADEPLPPDVIEELDQLLHNGGVAPCPPLADFPQSGGANTDRFLREALLLARLRHPAIPLLYDYFLENGHWYLVMEYVPGSTLASYMREHAPLPPLEGVNYALQICDVLDYLHRQSPPVVFRDLKPANVILHPDGRLMVVDFGIARYFKEGQFSDTTDFGSPGYASPEQYEGTGQTDARSDLFSLGVILHEMLSGQHPTRRGMEMEQLEALNKCNPAVSPALSGLVMVATRAEPMYRFQSARTFYQALERVRSVEERRAYRYHTLMAEVTAARKTPIFPLLIPPPSSQGFVSSELAREQDLRAQRMRMRERTQRSRPRVDREQETPTPPDESLTLHTLSSALTPNSSSPVMVPSIHLQTQEMRTEAALFLAPATPPRVPPAPRLLVSPLPQPRKHGKAWLLLSLLLIVLLLSGSLLAYRYFSSSVHARGVSRPTVFQPKRTQALPARPTSQPQNWQSLPSLPSQEADNTALYVASQGRDFVYITGGYRGAQSAPTYSRGLFRYDIAAARWTKVALAAFPAMGNNAAAEDQQGDLFFTGGYAPATGMVSSILYLYQPATGTLRTVSVPAQLPFGFGNSMWSDQQGHLYMTEGFLTPGVPSALAGTGWYRYDITSGLWQSLAPLPVGLGYVQLVQDANGNILLLGGARDAGQSQPSTRIYRFNPEQNVWSLVPATTPNIISGAESCPAAHGDLVVVGGYNAVLNRSLASAWLFNPQTFQWQPLPSLPGGGSVLGAAACDGQGHIYIARGANDPLKPTADFLELTLPGT